MRNRPFALFVTQFCLSLLTMLNAATLAVLPGESIQAQIDAASEGDIVAVFGGTYSEDITINKAIRLVEVSGQDVTILPVVVTHGTMTLTFGERIEAPGLDVDGSEQAGAVPTLATEGEVETEPAAVEYLRLPTTAEQVALGLNKMNLAASDIVAIFQAIDAAGALLGKLEIL